MHDLMRELAISVSEKENFYTVLYDGTSDNNDQEENGARRLSIQSNDRELLKSWKSMSHLRSLFVFAVKAISPSLTTLPSGLRLLRVLDLQDAPIVKLPDEVGHFFNLNLKGTKLEELPKSIGRLHNLQTLNTTDSKIEVLPDGITELQNLRHLIMYRYNYAHILDFYFMYGMRASSNICKLKNLQVLSMVEAETGLLKQARNMTQLTSFSIAKVREADEEDLCISIRNMKLLRNLLVMVSDEEEHLRMDALSSGPPRINRLALAGKLEKVPRWFPSLQTLTYLCLHWSRLNEDPLPYIQALPNLGKLDLINAYTGNQLSLQVYYWEISLN